MAVTTPTLVTPGQERQYREQGYFVVEDLFTPGEVERTREEITRIVDRHPDVPKEMVQMEPAVQRGDVQPPTKELGVRKLFRMAVHNDYFRGLAFHPRMVEIAKRLVGPDVKLAQSMLLMKPPHFGMVKVWHQDNAYFRLTPPDVFGFWIALDDADPENGCMHVIPGSHLGGLFPHDHARGDYGLIDEPSLADATPIPLRAGGALIFHGEICHYTPDNLSDRRRRALQYHYAASRCRQSEEKWWGMKGEVLVAGREYEDGI
jgi:phytanoyl-CoA hydroxylase